MHLSRNEDAGSFYAFYSLSHVNESSASNNRASFFSTVNVKSSNRSIILEYSNQTVIPSSQCCFVRKSRPEILHLHCVPTSLLLVLVVTIYLNSRRGLSS